MSRRAPVPSDAEGRAFVLEVEARRDPCDLCEQPLCYRACCFPPRTWAMVLHAWCHGCADLYDPERAGVGDDACPTCRRPWKRGDAYGAYR